MFIGAATDSVPPADHYQVQVDRVPVIAQTSCAASPTPSNVIRLAAFGRPAGIVQLCERRSPLILDAGVLFGSTNLRRQAEHSVGDYRRELVHSAACGFDLLDCFT